MPPTLLKLLQRFSFCNELMQQSLARCCRWLILAMVGGTALVISLRLFDIGSTALQESVSYMHAFLFMLTLAYTAQIGGHVRVDVFYRNTTAMTKAWINLFGSLFFLLPFAVFIAFISWEAALQSWAIKESSINPGGLPLVYLLKSLPPLCGFLLTLHALSEIAKQLLNISLIDEAAHND